MLPQTNLAEKIVRVTIVTVTPHYSHVYRYCVCVLVYVRVLFFVGFLFFLRENVLLETLGYNHM